MPIVNRKAKRERKAIPILTEKTSFSVSEAYKAARTNLLFTFQNQKWKKIIVTSAGPNEGKSTSCCNLGITMAQMHSRVLILDCDLRRPVIHTCFNRPGVPGLSELLAGMTNDVLGVVQNTDYTNLNILSGGTIPPNAAELLSGSRMYDILNILSQNYEYILLDTPPVNLVADAVALSAITDGVILIVKQGQTTHPELAHTLASLKFANAKVLGIIMNGVEADPYGKKFGYKKYKNYYNTNK